MRVQGTPNHVTMFLQTNLLASTSLMLASGSALTHLVKYSMPTSKYFLFPVALGKGSTISRPH